MLGLKWVVMTSVGGTPMSGEGHWCHSSSVAQAPLGSIFTSRQELHSLSLASELITLLEADCGNKTPWKLRSWELVLLDCDAKDQVCKT